MFIKSISVFALASFALASFALTPKEINKKFQDKDYPGYIAAFDANPATAATGRFAGYQVGQRVQAAWATGAIKTVAEAFALVDNACAATGVTDPDQILKAKTRAVWPWDPRVKSGGAVKDFGEVYKLVKNAASPTFDFEKAYAFEYYESATEAEKAQIYSLYLSAKNYFAAFRTARASTAEKFAAVEKYVAGKDFYPQRTLQMLNFVCEVNADATITPARIKTLLQAANRKYAKMLISDKEAWEPVLSLVRTTLEAY